MNEVVIQATYHDLITYLKKANFEEQKKRWKDGGRNVWLVGWHMQGEHQILEGAGWLNALNLLLENKNCSS